MVQLVFKLICLFWNCGIYGNFLIFKFHYNYLSTKQADLLSKISTEKNSTNNETNQSIFSYDQKLNNNFFILFYQTN